MVFQILAGIGITGVLGYLANKFYFSGGRCKSKNRIDGKIVVITGANTGLGYEVALDLAKRGGRIVMACRDLKKAEKAANQIRLETDNQRIDIEYLDLSDLESVRSFSKFFILKYDRLDILINNAGIMQCPYWKTKQGYEMQFGVNHLGHFLLTNLLLDLIKKTKNSRVINVSSLAHKGGKINWDDINSEKSYSPLKAYYQTKLANVLFTNELARRLEGFLHTLNKCIKSRLLSIDHEFSSVNDKIYDITFSCTGVTSVSLHPGLVRTEILRYSKSKVDIALYYLVIIMYPIWWLVSKSPVEGAQTTIHCAIDDEVPKQNGSYFTDCKPADKAPQAMNEDDARRLWDLSARLVNL